MILFALPIPIDSQDIVSRLLFAGELCNECINGARIII